MPDLAISTVWALFQQRGDEAYDGEPVSQLEHAVQAAQIALEETGDIELAIAALLHDVGHLLPHHLEFKNIQINIDKNVSNWKAFKAIMTAEAEKGYGLNSLNEVQSAIKVNYINTFEFFSVDQDNGGN